MKKLFVFDVDGTLLTSDIRILQSTKEALKLVQAQGHEILLASARPPMGIEPLLLELGTSSLYISLNGALIVDNNEILFEERIPSEGVNTVLNLARSYNLSINFYSGERWLIEDENPYSAAEAKVVGFQPELGDLEAIAKVHKILVIGPEPDVKRFQKELQAMSSLVNASISLPNYCEIVSSKVSKATALKQVCYSLGIELKDTVAFGDGENDLEMLKLAGKSVAMGNSHPALLAQADYITSSNDQDGIMVGVRWALS